MPIYFRRYLLYTERKSEYVSPLWKVLHTLIFMVIVVTAFCSAFTFHDIFDSFQFQCVLYAKPYFELTNITRHKGTTKSYVNKLFEQNDDISKILLRVARQMENITEVEINYQTEIEINNQTETPINSHTTIANNSSANVTSSVTEWPILTHQTTYSNEPVLIIRDGAYWISNSTLTARLMVDYRQTLFGSVKVCNVVLFYPLATLVLGSFMAVIVMICGRGGQGYPSDILPQPWLYVGPVFIISVIMIIVGTVISSLLSNGMETFCEEFEIFTQEHWCSEKINNFTTFGYGRTDLYDTYILCLISNLFTIILWILQLALTILRIICVADFKLNMVIVTCKKKDAASYQREWQLHNQVRSSLEKRTYLMKGLKSREDKKDKATQVHTALKNKGLKKVTFVEPETNKDDHDDDNKTTEV